MIPQQDQSPDTSRQALAAEDDADHSIIVEGLTLYYPLLTRQRQNSLVRFWCLIYDLMGRSNFASNDSFFAALNDVSFKLKSGEILGVVGPNGAGKSTLLRVLANIETPDEGTVILNGRVSSLLELGVGFKQELSGRENIYLNSMLLGIPKSEVSKYIQDIVEFCDIGEFVDAPLKTYSSGMKARLGFSTAIKLDPEILLLDEVLGSGDAAFRARAGNIIHHYRSREKTVVVATHSDAFIVNNCDKALFLNHGEVVTFGYPEDVIDEYSRFTGYMLRKRTFFGAHYEPSRRPDREGDTRPPLGVAICGGTSQYEKPLFEYLKDVGPALKDVRLELAMIPPQEVERPNLCDMYAILLIPVLPRLKQQQYVGLRRFVRNGGILVLGAGAALQLVVGRDSMARDRNTDIVNYCLSALGNYEPGRSWGRFELSAYQLTKESPLLPGLSIGRSYGMRAGDNPVIGAMMSAAPGAYSLATVQVKDMDWRATVGSCDALVAKKSGEGVVFRFASPPDPSESLFSRLVNTLVHPDGAAFIRASEPHDYGVPGDPGGPEASDGQMVPLESCALRLSVIGDVNRRPRLLSQAELRESFEEIADLGLEQVNVVVKEGSALTENLGIEAYDFVTDGRDILAEAGHLADEFGLSIVPAVNCFVEHVPGSPGQATRFVSEHPETLHLTMRNISDGMYTIEDFDRRGVRIQSSPHLERVRERIKTVVQCLKDNYGFDTCHLEFFRYSNDSGGFSEAELAAKGGLSIESDLSEHQREAARCLADFARELQLTFPEMHFSLEAYHDFSISHPCHSLTVGMYSKKCIPANILAYYLRHYLDVVAEARPLGTCRILIDCHHKTAGEVLAQIAVGRSLECGRFYLDGYDALRELEEADRRRFATILKAARHDKHNRK